MYENSKMKTLNESDDKIAYDLEENFFSHIDNIDSFETTEIIRRVKIFATFLILLVGLIGHSLTISVFGQKKFRKNSSNVVSLCLAINDSLFLIINCFEDITIDLKELYLSNLNNEIVNSLLNLVNENLFTCCMIHYLKYVLRFLSAFTFTELTIHRLIAVYFLFWIKLKTKTLAWKTIMATVITSLIANIWILYAYEIIHDDDKSFCQVKQSLKSKYYEFNMINVFVIVAVPILTILICNSLIIVKLFKRNSEQLISLISKKNSSNIITNVIIGDDKSKTLTKRLIFKSFTYVLFSLPYILTWSSFVLGNRNKSYFDQVNWFLWFQVTELIYNINFSLHFYMYCISGSLFRSQLKSRFI